MNNPETLPESMPVHPEVINKTRKEYHKPELGKLGDLRTLTLGASVFNNTESSIGNGLDYWPLF
jgi:hypothetical protein